MTYVGNHFVYHEGEDPENPGILLPRYRAVSRTAPNGEVYKPTKTRNELDLVPVRSIISKCKGDLYTITPDLIGKIGGINDLTDGAGIGMSYATSFTEATTQSMLGLKHGGHERVLDESGYLKAPKDCSYRTDDKWIYLKVKGKKDELKYPKPNNLVEYNKTEFAEGESCCCLYKTNSPGYRLNALITLMKAKPALGKRFYEKDNIISSDCYAYEDGEIHYVEDDRGNIDVYIGDRLYLYNPDCMYYFPDGAKVKKFQRICSGILRMDLVLNNLDNDLSMTYLLFRRQVYELLSGDYAKNGVLGDSEMKEEILELLFAGMTRIDRDTKDNSIKEIEFLGSQNSILNKKSFYTVMSYGYGSKNINKAMKGELNLSGDFMTETVLGLLLRNKLDE